MTARANFLEEGRLLAKGVSVDMTRWNRVSIGESVYTVERAPQLQAKINLDEILFTPAFEKGPHKDKCFLCKLYFARKSISKMVPNHRMLDLQRKWNMPLEGNRYKCGSFLYASSKVCTFCAQLFQDVEPVPEAVHSYSLASKSRSMYEWSNSHSDTFSQTSASIAAGSTIGTLLLERGRGATGSPVSADGGAYLNTRAGGRVGVGEGGFSLDEGSIDGLSLIEGSGVYPGSPTSPASPSKLARMQSKKKTQALLRGPASAPVDVAAAENLEKLTIRTEILRRDIAPGNRVYQSSTVDNLQANNAILPPYSKSTRTRREVDPWWELDFSRRHHIDNLTLQILTGHSQRIFVSVVLLSRPTGFEDPFLDSVIPRAVAWKEFILPENASPTWEAVSWALPAGTVCAAIRVQIRGIHTLSIKVCYVLN